LGFEEEGVDATEEGVVVVDEVKDDEEVEVFKIEGFTTTVGGGGGGRGRAATGLVVASSAKAASLKCIGTSGTSFSSFLTEYFVERRLLIGVVGKLSVELVDDVGVVVVPERRHLGGEDAKGGLLLVDEGAGVFGPSFARRRASGWRLPWSVVSPVFILDCCMRRGRGFDDDG
jgi:hypothetical protein